jgi:hypothetical protein
MQPTLYFWGILSEKLFYILSEKSFYLQPKLLHIIKSDLNVKEILWKAFQTEVCEIRRWTLYGFALLWIYIVSKIW